MQSASLRLLSVSLALFSLSALTACGNKPAPTTVAPTAAPTATAPAPVAPTPPTTEPAAAPAVVAADPHVLMTSKGCVACHKTDAKLIGPSYQDVAKKYAGKPDAKTYLTKKILDGGSGVWGPVAMTPNRGKVTDEEAGILVDWILAGAR